jgi:protein-disulfide isomerase
VAEAKRFLIYKLKNNKNMQNNNKYYIYSALTIAIALAIMPFTTFLMQKYLLPKLGEALIGDLIANEGKPQEDKELKGQEIKLDLSRNMRGDISKTEIVMIEYSDYECYFCNQFHPSIKSVFEKANGKIAWAYRHFPLEQIHPNAKPAAIASECVHKLGGNDNFWKYTDTLIANNKSFSAQYFEAEAVKLGINKAAYTSCIQDPATAKVVAADQLDGANFGIQGTPNTIIAKKEGDKYIILESINGALPLAAVQAIVNKYTK